MLQKQLNKPGRRQLLLLFGLFLLANAVYIHRVPGLIGDEGSEGQNVYELLQAKPFVVMGERSYIGPLIDYVRVPFIWFLGYTTLSLRAVTLLVSAATFWLAWTVFRRLFGEEAALWATVSFAFSPIYLLEQRLGWAITLFPFFGLLLLSILTSARPSIPYRAALAGLAAGLGLHNYMAFFPTIAAIVVPAAWYGVWQVRGTWRDRLRWLANHWTAPLGFWAGFGTQFAVMQIFREDQGNVAEVVSMFGQRLADVPKVLPLVLSGSAYIARYIGEGMSGPAIFSVVSVIVFLAALAFIFPERRKVSLYWLSGLLIQLMVLLVMIDRFTLRYFVVFVLGLWVVAGIGAAGAWQRLEKRWLDLKRIPAPAIVAGLLITWLIFSVLMPYLKTGGSTQRFSLGNRTDTAADFVDLRPLLACVGEAGPVYSEDIQIQNRLLYLMRDDKRLQVPESKFDAHWLVAYRKPGEKAGEKCPELAHFRLVKRK